MKIPEKISTFKSLQEWIISKHPKQIKIGLKSPLRRIPYFDPSSEWRLDRVRGTQIVYEGLNEPIQKLFKPQTTILLKQRINEILKHGFDGKDLVIPTTGFSVTFGRKDIINAIYKIGKI